MKRPDEAVERVLEGLRRVEVPEGLEQRVLRGVEGEVARESGVRAGSRGIAGVRDAGSARRAAMWGGAALASVLVVGFGMTALDRAGEGRRATMGPAAVAVVAEPRGVVARGPVSGAGSGAGVGAGARARVRGRVRSVAAGREALARDRAGRRGVSYPAPPLPLTAQERLLLQVAHAGDPEEYAMLELQARVKQEERQRAEFKEFFPEPPESVDRAPILDEK